MGSDKANQMNDVFPDGLKSVEEADPDMASFLKQEKTRQW